MNSCIGARSPVAVAFRHASLLATGAMLVLGTAATARAQVVAAPAATPAATPAAMPAVPVASLDSAWGAISRTYWDTLLVQGAWRAAYDSIRASLDPAADDDAVRRAIRALIAVPRQSHFTLIPGSAAPVASAPSTPSGSAAGTGPGTTGILARSVGDTVVVWRVAPGSPAARAGFRPGDAILALDSLAIDSVRARIAATGEERDVVRRLVTTFVLARLGGTAGDSIRVTRFDARGARHTRWLVRAPMEGRRTQFGNLPPIVVTSSRDSVSVGSGRFATVLTFSTWLPVISPELDRHLFGSRHADGLIVDLRGNPGGVVGMVAGVSGHLLDTAIALGTMRGRGATIRFVANPRRVDRSGTSVEVFAGPVAILVDGFTASTSEFFAAGLQAIGRARIFGERSAGMSLPALTARLPNGDVLMHAIADHEDAAGRRIEGVGVIPDELVPLSRVDLRNGRDAPLDAARAWIAAQLP